MLLKQTKRFLICPEEWVLDRMRDNISGTRVEIFHYRQMYAEKGTLWRDVPDGPSVSGSESYRRVGKNVVMEEAAGK